MIAITIGSLFKNPQNKNRMVIVRNVFCLKGYKHFIQFLSLTPLFHPTPLPHLHPCKLYNGDNLTMFLDLEGKLGIGEHSHVF